MIPSVKRTILIWPVRIRDILESLRVEFLYSPMAPVIVVSILIMIPTLLMRVWVLPMGIISPIWVSDTSLPRKRVLIPLAILIPMTGHLCVSIWIRMVILNGTEIRGRKFSVPETGEPGRFQPFRQTIIPPPIKERLPSVPETISLWSCTLNMVEARVLSSVLVPQVSHFPPKLNLRIRHRQECGLSRNFLIQRISRHNSASWPSCRVWPRIRPTTSGLMPAIHRVRTGRMQPPVL